MVKVANSRRTNFNKINQSFILPIVNLGLKTGAKELVWQLPQIVLGWLIAHIYNMVMNINIQQNENALVIKTNNYFGGLSLGHYIIGDKTIEATPHNQLFRHEYGHCLQSKYWGWLYLPVFGLPSLISAMFSSPMEHSIFYTEKNANNRSSIYFTNFNRYINKSKFAA
jgi:hypothetical protein